MRQAFASVREMWWESELELKRSRDGVINGLVYQVISLNLIVLGGQPLKNFKEGGSLVLAHSLTVSGTEAEVKLERLDLESGKKLK